MSTLFFWNKISFNKKIFLLKIFKYFQTFINIKYMIRNNIVYLWKKIVYFFA